MVCALCNEMTKEHRVIQKNRESIAITNFEPLAEGHSMVLPVRHVHELIELTEKESKSLLEMIQSVSNMLRKTVDKDCIVFLHRGKHASQPHLHFHVVPADEALRETFARAYHTPPRKRVSDEELSRIRKRILDANK